MDSRDENRQIQSVIKKILQGDVNAFSFLVEKYKKLVAHIVFRMIYNQTDREDICQDVFLKVYQNLSQFRADSKFSTWIGKITYNSCLNYISKNKNPMMTQSVLEWEEMPAENSDPVWQIERDERGKRIRTEINQLPVQYRAILTLFHLEHMSYREIGEIMNLPEGTVKSYLYRARQHLKQELDHKYQIQDL
jgi:RNA polymerase sigma-70 factor (ECF subfamily)